MKIKSYRELNIWKKGIDIVDKIYDITEKFPEKEKFGLRTHLQKTAVSIPSNIAEGFVRQYPKEYKQFLHISLGSCAELQTQLFIAKKRNYVNNDDFHSLDENIDHESRMLRSLIKKIA